MYIQYYKKNNDAVIKINNSGQDPLHFLRLNWIPSPSDNRNRNRVIRDVTCLIARGNRTSFLLFVIAIYRNGCGAIRAWTAAEVTVARCARGWIGACIDRRWYDTTNSSIVVVATIAVALSGLRVFDVDLGSRHRSVRSSDHRLRAQQRFECKSESTTPRNLIVTSGFVYGNQTCKYLRTSFTNVITAQRTFKHEDLVVYFVFVLAQQ